MNYGLGSVFEQSLRYLLLLYEIEDKSNINRICMLDYIATYAADFDLETTNLHGYSEYRFNEYASRSMTAFEALQELAYRNLIHVIPTNHGLQYAINDSGQTLCTSLISDYADEYLNIIDEVNETISSWSDKKIEDMIMSLIKNHDHDNDGAGI